MTKPYPMPLCDASEIDYGIDRKKADVIVSALNESLGAGFPGLAFNRKLGDAREGAVEMAAGEFRSEGFDVEVCFVSRSNWQITLNPPRYEALSEEKRSLDGHAIVWALLSVALVALGACSGSKGVLVVGVNLLAAYVLWMVRWRR